MVYADFSYYACTFLGNEIAEMDFPRLALRASNFLDYYTRGKARSATDSDVLTALASACCAVAERMNVDEQNRKLAAAAVTAALDGGEVKSETVGSWSRTYSTASDYKQSGVEADRAGRLAYANIATEYLLNTGLLYRGGCSL